MTALAYIPCKLGAGSKRLLSKNLLPCGGVPLVRRAVDVAAQAQALGLVDRVVVVVSHNQPWRTNEEIELEDTILAGAVCAIIPRPDSNARQVLREWLADQGAQAPDLICQLLPTSPLRTLRHVVESRLLLTEGTDVVMSMTPFRQDVRGACYVAHGCVVKAAAGESFPGGAEPLKHDGTILWGRTRYVLSDEFQARGWYAPGLRTVAYPVPAWESADVDDDLGLFVADAMLRHQKGEAP